MRPHIAVVVGLLAAGLWATAAAGAPPAAADAGEPDDGFRRARGSRTWAFPRDHGRHDAYRIEWWYYTGIVRTTPESSTAGRTFGYQVTFFRQGLPGNAAARSSAWATDALYLAHVALSDVAESRFRPAAALARDSLGLAGAAPAAHTVWLKSWRADALPDDPHGARLQVEAPDFALELTLRTDKGPVLHGEGGLDRKGPAPGQASWYYSLPRLRTTGTVHVAGATHRVQGTTWMDHEFGTNQLGPQQAGWDWFAVRLDNGWDVMVYRLRRKDGTTVDESGGTLVTPDGTATPLAVGGAAPGRVRLEPLRHWRSAATGATYPVAWRLVAPDHDLRLEVRPYFDAQEQPPSAGTPFPYWEGAVRVEGTHGGAAVQGEGYVELTGYAGDLGGAFR